MVTHNIEEAVLMCDRILVFSSNPGRVAAELKVALPHPRNRLDPGFRRMVDDIYTNDDAAHAGRSERPGRRASLSDRDGLAACLNQPDGGIVGNAGGGAL